MRYTINVTDRAKSIVADMDFRALLDQIVCEHAMPEQWDTIGSYGSFFFHATEKDVLARKIQKLKCVCTIPPLITTDMENGPGGMIVGGTKFPQFLGLGVAGDAELAYEAGRIAAIEGGQLGYNWTLSPVVDLLGLDESPMVSTRAAGRSPEHTIEIAGAYVRGLQDHGMIATLKHFPGDGFDIYDQHLTTPVNPQSKEEWLAGSGMVYKKLIDRGIMSIMPGHIALPAWDDDDYGVGLPPPATVSKKLMTGLLKEELGFDGLIVSDAINMAGIVNYMNYHEAATAFFEAGGDVLLFVRMDDRMYAGLERMVDAGKLSLETLRARAARVVALKEQIGLLDGEPATPSVDYDAHAATARKVVDKCTCLVRDRASNLPAKISKDTRILHCIITNADQGELPLYRSFTRVIERHSDNVTELCNPNHGSQVFGALQDGRHDLVICSIGNRYSYGTNVVRIYGSTARGMMGGWMKVGVPVIFVLHYHPLTFREYEAAMDTVINTYGSTEQSFDRVMDAITGKVELPPDPILDPSKL
jgi:beta-N-acetylhexosaminidase